MRLRGIAKFRYLGASPQSQPEGIQIKVSPDGFRYSDDDGATWSEPHELTTNLVLCSGLTISFTPGSQRI